MIDKITGILKRLFFESFPEGEAEAEEAVVIERSQTQELKFPDQLDASQNYRIIKWFVNTGSELKKGDELCKIENENKESMVFQSFMIGRLNYKFPVNQTLKRNSVIAKVGSLE